MMIPGQQELAGQIKKDAIARDIRMTSVARRTTRHLSWKYGSSVRFHPYPLGERKKGKIACLKIHGKIVVEYEYLPSPFHVEDDIARLTNKKSIR